MAIQVIIRRTFEGEEKALKLAPLINYKLPPIEKVVMIA